MTQSFFHNYANHHRNLNSKAKIRNSKGQTASSFPKIANVGVCYFSKLFSPPQGCPIKEILEVVELSPRSIREEMNGSLYANILEGKIMSTLEAFQKRKSSGPNGFSV